MAAEPRAQRGLDPGTLVTMEGIEVGREH